MRKSFILLLAILFWPSLCLGWPAKIISVTDGDTVNVAPAGAMDTPVAVRLYGIDAPELSQPGGSASADYLKKLLPKWADVEVIPYGVDRYGRALGLIIRAKKCVNGLLVEAGHAWVYGKYCKAKFCKGWKQAQKKAAASGLGLWIEKDAVAPWEWRKKK